MCRPGPCPACRRVRTLPAADTASTTNLQPCSLIPVPRSLLVNWKSMIPTLQWLPEGVNFLDQTKLPLQETYVLATDYKQVATVIKDMIVRGAMAIGVSAAMGVALGIDRSTATTLPSSPPRSTSSAAPWPRLAPLPSISSGALPRSATSTPSSPPPTPPSPKLRDKSLPSPTGSTTKTSPTCISSAHSARSCCRSGPPFSPTATPERSPPVATGRPWE